MLNNLKYRSIIFFAFVIYLTFFILFYWKYVPLISSFQVILISFLLVILIPTIIKVEWGILSFVFFFPLINILPYFYRIDENIPHAPTALVLFLSFFMGWQINNFFKLRKINCNTPVFKPIILLSLIILASGLITILRFANFFPFLSSRVYELIVNVNEVRAGGAIMSTVFSLLNYITGFIFFYILINSIKSKEFIRKILFTLMLSTLIILMFSLIQKYFSMGLGNTQLWESLSRINGTFKDPNSFGVYLSAFLPILLGMFFIYSGRKRILIVFIAILSLIIFPSIGSRSGLLGFFISIIVFSLLYLKSKKNMSKIRVRYIFSTLFILVLMFFSFIIFSKNSTLFTRINQNITSMNNKDYLQNLFTKRLYFWSISSNMIKNYPLTGIGLGAYIVEQPNYFAEIERPFKHTDSAENYFFQIGSELGLVGLFLSLWLFYEIIKLVHRAWENKVNNKKDFFILIGTISALCSIFVNLIVHSYIGAFEVKYFLWLLIAVVFILSRKEEKLESKRSFGKKFKYIVVILPLLFCIVHLWNSTHTLSIKERTKIYGWGQNFGVYSQEGDKKGLHYFWAKKKAGITANKLGKVIVLPIKASHPDIEKRSVKVKIYAADQYFNKKQLIEEVELTKTKWIKIEYIIPESSKDKVQFIFETSRSWKPFKYLGTADKRDLAIAIGELWFRFPLFPKKGKFMNVERISSDNWQGKQNARLYSNGISRVLFKAARKKTALMLHVKGRKAFDVGPIIIVRLDESIIGRTILDEEGWMILYFYPELSLGKHEFSIEFINDFYAPDLGEDRNVILGDLEMAYY